MQPQLLDKLHQGTVIPAHPLALHEDRTLDEQRQRALTRYYMACGVGGIAVGVHTTQFEIRDPQFNLYERVLALAMDEVKQADKFGDLIKIGGISGPTEQAIQEAKLLKRLGYDLALLSMGGLMHLTEEQLLDRTQQVGEIIPVVGFYLQPAVGGRILSYSFWERFAELSCVKAIKVAPFDRYLTQEVVRAVAHSSRRDEIALYTGNDDHIVEDLLMPYSFDVKGERVTKQFVGGLLGHWAVWTKEAVGYFQTLQTIRESGSIPSTVYELAQQVTDANSAFFDSHHQFKGSIAGINEVLTRQGLLRGNWCLMDHERLSVGQAEEIDRVYASYPHLSDDTFVKENLRLWLDNEGAFHESINQRKA